jgi:hypothetical protein
MRTQFAIALVATLAAGAFVAPAISATTPQQANMKSCAANWSGMAAADKSKTTYKDYMSTCLKAPAAAPAAMTAKPAAVATPAAMTAKPAAAAAMKAESGSAKCKDGKTVTYTHRSGTCSGHGGVASWM